MFPRYPHLILTSVLRRPFLPRRYPLALSGVIACWVCSSPLVLAQEPAIRLAHDAEIVEIQAVSPNIVRIHVQPDGKVSPRTLVMDPSLQPAGAARFERNGGIQTLSSPEMKVVVTDDPPFSVEVQDQQGKTLVTIRSDSRGGRGFPGGGAPGRGAPGATAPGAGLRGGGQPGGGGAAGRGTARGGTVILHDENENLYGIHGSEWHDNGLGILRNIGGAVAAGYQGDGGAPFFFTRRYGILVDSDGGSFQASDETIRFQRGSRPDTEYFVIVGPPLKTMAGLAALTGKPPMPPKWTLGLLNSQWGSTEQEWRQITAKYQEEGIPISGYILDFDWKAWGEDDYGEWRWNSTSGGAASRPNKFPDGASGKFAADLLAHGIHLAGILKPRLIIDPLRRPADQAAAYATEHNFWYPERSPRHGQFQPPAGRQRRLRQCGCQKMVLGASRTRLPFWNGRLVERRSRPERENPCSTTSSS